MMLKKVLAISGSTRSDSSNLRLLRFLERMTADRLEWEFYPSVAALPPFNPDLDGDDVPVAVAEFRGL